MYNQYKKIMGLIALVTISSIGYAQDLSQAKLAIDQYIKSWTTIPEDQEWLLEVDGVKFPTKGLDIGLKTLEENLKKSDISKVEKQQIKERFIQTYIDQSAILALSHQELLENPNLDILLQEFLRQAATQFWLEKQMEQTPEAMIPTEDEINKYYQDNSDRLLRLGLSASQIKAYTDQELRQSKLQEWTYNKLEELKKENPTTINPKLKKKLGL